MKSLKFAWVALVVGVAAPSAFAAATWGFQQPGICTQGATNKNNMGNGWACDVGGGNPLLNASAYATTGIGGKFAAAYLDDNGGSGFGVKNSVEGVNATSPQHAMDNETHTDVMLLSFASSVILRQLTLGWSSNDADVSVLRFTGTTAPDLTSKTVSTLIGTNGWELVGNYDFTHPATNVTKDINASGKSSSWWLISAYNSTFGGTVLDSNKDYVKVLAVAADKTTTTTTRVPEPGSLALAGLAIAGVAVTRRRTKKTC